MKKIDDRELQKLMDENRAGSVSNNPEVTGADAKAYQVLYDALDAEPLQSLSYNFSSKVTRKVLANNKRSNELKFYVVGLITLIVLTGAIYITLLLTKPTAGTDYIRILLKYKWVFILSIFSFLTIQYLDQILVKSRIFKKQ